MNQNPDQNQPASKAEAPNPAHNYERAKPERESPQQSLDWKQPQTHEHPDKAGPESTSRHTNQPNSDSMEYSTSEQAQANPASVQHSMKEEEPAGWDQAPNTLPDDQKRHPRTEGKGGVP